MKIILIVGCTIVGFFMLASGWGILSIGCFALAGYLIGLDDPTTP